jgi:hypothetical protein
MTPSLHTREIREHISHNKNTPIIATPTRNSGVTKQDDSHIKNAGQICQHVTIFISSTMEASFQFTDRAFFVIGEFVFTSMLGITGQAQEATGYNPRSMIESSRASCAKLSGQESQPSLLGIDERRTTLHTLGTLATSTRHMRQLPATDKRS